MVVGYHYLAAEILDIIIALNTRRAKLLECWKLRKEIYHQLLNYLVWAKDTDAILIWMLSWDPQILDSNYREDDVCHVECQRPAWMASLTGTGGRLECPVQVQSMRRLDCANISHINLASACSLRPPQHPRAPHPLSVRLGLQGTAPDGKD